MVKRPGALQVFSLLLIIGATLAAGTGPCYSAPQAQAEGPRFEVSELIVTDVETCLVWLRDGNKADQDLSWDDAHEYVALLNRQKYAGHSDWRLPDIDELKKFQVAATKARLTGFCGNDAVVSRLCQEGFMNVQAGSYWSGTTNMFFDVEAWFIDMTSGSPSTANKALYMYVWPVHTEGGCSKSASGQKDHNRSTQKRK